METILKKTGFVIVLGIALCMVALSSEATSPDTPTQTTTATQMETPTATPTPSQTLTPVPERIWYPMGSALNTDELQYADMGNIDCENDNTYAAWIEVDAYGHSDIHTRKWEGYSWGAPGNGVSYNGGDVKYPTLAVLSNQPYLAFQQVPQYYSQMALYVKQFTGSGWQALGGDLRVNSSLEVYGKHHVVVRNGYPCVAWCESYYNTKGTYVKQWNGTDWEQLGGDLADGSQAYRQDPVLAVDGSGFLYAAFSLLPNIVVKKWNGTQWEQVGNAITSYGAIAWTPHLVIYENVPYVIWYGVTDGGAPYPVYVRRFVNGAWEALGGNLNDNYNNRVLGTGLEIIDGILFAAINVYQNGSWDVVVKHYEGGNWISDGVADLDAGEDYYEPYLTVDQSSLCVAMRKTATSGQGVVQVNRYMLPGMIPPTVTISPTMTISPTITTTPSVSPTITATSTVTPLPTVVYQEEFNGTPGAVPPGWRGDTSGGIYFLANIFYSDTPGLAGVTRTTEHMGAGWGKVESPLLRLADPQYHNVLEVNVARISEAATWKVGIQQVDYPYTFYGLNTSTSATGTFYFDYASVTGLGSYAGFRIVFILEGDETQNMDIDWVKIYHCVATPTPTPVTGWNEVFLYSDDSPVSSPGDQPPGWYDESNDANLNAQLAYATTDGLVELSTVTGESWGKVLSFSQDVDLGTYPILEVTFSEMVSGTAKIAVFSQNGGWEEYLLSGSVGTPGTYGYNIPAATGWNGLKNMGVALYIEGEGAMARISGVRIHNGVPSVPSVTPTGSATATATPTSSPTMTVTPTMTPNINVLWLDTFNGASGEQASNWADETQDGSFNAQIAYSMVYASQADIILTGEANWGKVLGPALSGDVDLFPSVEVCIQSVDTGHAWKLGIQELEGTYQYWDLNTGNTGTGSFEYNYQNVTGWTGSHAFAVVLIVEGSSGSVSADWVGVGASGEVHGAAVSGAMYVCPPTHTATPTGTPHQTPPATSTPAATQAADTVTPTRTPTASQTPYVKAAEVLPYPNPARGKVNFAYTIAGPGKVKIDIYKLTGERVASIVESVNGGAGQTLSTAWKAADVAPGIYFCRIVITDASDKVVLDQKKKVALIQ